MSSRPALGFSYFYARPEEIARINRRDEPPIIHFRNGKTRVLPAAIRRKFYDESKLLHQYYLVLAEAERRARDAEFRKAENVRMESDRLAAIAVLKANIMKFHFDDDFELYKALFKVHGQWEDEDYFKQCCIYD